MVQKTKRDQQKNTKNCKKHNNFVTIKNTRKALDSLNTALQRVELQFGNVIWKGEIILVKCKGSKCLLVAYESSRVILLIFNLHAL